MPWFTFSKLKTSRLSLAIANRIRFTNPYSYFSCQCHFRINWWLLKLNLVWVSSDHIYSSTDSHVQCYYIIYYKKYARFKVRISFKFSDIQESLSNCAGLRLLNKTFNLIKHLIPEKIHQYESQRFIFAFSKAHLPEKLDRVLCMQSDIR